MKPPAIRFTVDQAQQAGDGWHFSCGPGAICGMLGLTPDQVRPHMGDFERKGYTNPMLMYSSLRSLGAKWSATVTPKGGPNEWPSFGLVRIQWEGPWTEPGVPMRARYRATHWVGSFRDGDTHMVFDLNATCVGGWISFEEWSGKLVPWKLSPATNRPALPVNNERNEG